MSGAHDKHDQLGHHATSGMMIKLFRRLLLLVLTPYYLPLFTLPLLLLRPIAPQSIQQDVDVLIGVTYAFHLLTSIKDFGWKQTDIKSMGRIFSTGAIILFQTV